jgi:hypothetical protein
MFDPDTELDPDGEMYNWYLMNLYSKLKQVQKFIIRKEEATDEWGFRKPYNLTLK